MIGRFLYGAGVGGVMAATGFALASLLQEPGNSPILSATETPSADPVVAPKAATLTPEEKAPESTANSDSANPSDPAAPIVATDGEPTETAEVITPEAARPKAGPPPPGTPYAANPIAEANPDVMANTTPEDTKLAGDVTAAVTPAATPAAAPDTVAIAPKPPVTTAPDATVIGSIPDAAAPPVLAEIAGPLIPDQPLQPPLPVKDTVPVAAQPPALPKTPDDTLTALADPQADMLQTPEVTDPSPLPAAGEALPLAPVVDDKLPEMAASPDPKPAPEAAVEAPLPDPDAPSMPGTEAPSMPGSKAGTLPGSNEPATATNEDGTRPPIVTANDTPTLKPTPGLGLKTEGLIIGRAPKIGDAPQAEDAVITDDRPIAKYARTFENPEGKPLFAIILIDTGAPDLDRATLAQLPFPVSFALDPLAPDSVKYAAIYRSAGQEVVMLATGIAEGAQASDIEVAFQTMDQGLPESVVVMDLPSLSFQDNRPLATLVVPVVAAQGRGLVTWDKGLNAADQVARREALAAAVIFRNLDGAGEDKAAIRRLLDRAAFKATQDGRVTVVGQTLPDTVAALLEWTVEGRAATVAIAPISAVVSVR